MPERKKLGEGKTKVIWEDPRPRDDDPRVPDMVLVEAKDDITAGDGASRDLLEGKAVASTTTTVNVFELLRNDDIPTHYVSQYDERTFRAVHCQMVPLELVVRRIATGSYLKRRPDVSEGTVFDPLVVEFFVKDDEAHDPLVIVDTVGNRLLQYQAGKPLAEGFLRETPVGETVFVSGRTLSEITADLSGLALRTFQTIEAAWAVQDVQLVDLKIECGWFRLLDKVQLVVADVIDNDSWRIWPGGDRTQMKDKQVYRDLAGVDDPKTKAKDLGRIKDNYQWVAEQTSQFLKSAP